MLCLLVGVFKLHPPTTHFCNLHPVQILIIYFFSISSSFSHIYSFKNAIPTRPHAIFDHILYSNYYGSAFHGSSLNAPSYGIFCSCFPRTLPRSHLPGKSSYLLSQAVSPTFSIMLPFTHTRLGYSLYPH